jgi:predicted alpha/beta superfamily hydrolase
MPLIENDWFKDRVQGAYGIGGSSLGGLISCYAAYTRPTKYKTAICMSSSFWWNSEDFNSKILSVEKVYDGSKFYIDSGDSGPSQDGKNQTVTVYQHMSKIGYKVNQTLFYYLDKGGQHSEYYWGARFLVPMTKLYP